ncbi:MAG: hypothetical protein WA964_06020 [Ilumatobacter sp.]|uniref:hypothetical protein n=1 Tax=Ilumatobacter sp. TaxID=1967498 RepID=UPI003C74B8E4
MRSLLIRHHVKRRVALLVPVAIFAAACAGSSEVLKEQYEALSDERYAAVNSCTVKTGDGPDRLLVDHALIETDVPLPPDIVFTEILATSPAGFDFEPVAVLGDASTIRPHVLLGQDAPAAARLDFASLPFSPDRSQDFALGVILEIPAGAPANPPMAVEITGAEYTTGGQTYTLGFKRSGYVSRLAADGTYCENFGSGDFQQTD